MVRPSEEAPISAALLAEIADLPYFRVDAHRTVVEASPAMERLTGFSAVEAVGRSCLNLHRCEECLRGCGLFECGTVRDRPLELYRADGSTVRVRKSGRVLRDAAGHVIGAVEVLRPVDENGPGSQVAEGEGPEGALPADADEIAAIRDALRRTRYNRTEAARLLDMSRTTLWRKMREHGL